MVIREGELGAPTIGRLYFVLDVRYALCGELHFVLHNQSEHHKVCVCVCVGGRSFPHLKHYNFLVAVKTRALC